jgi:hypothetical protein
MILKLMGQGWMIVFRMIRSDAGLLNPEDLLPGPTNPNPRPGQPAPNDHVERPRRIHRNDLEIIPALLACGLLYVATGPSPIVANILLFAFSAAHFAHTLAYHRAAPQSSRHAVFNRIDHRHRSTGATRSGHGILTHLRQLRRASGAASDPSTVHIARFRPPYSGARKGPAAQQSPSRLSRIWLGSHSRCGTPFATDDVLARRDFTTQCAPPACRRFFKAITRHAVADHALRYRGTSPKCAASMSCTSTSSPCASGGCMRRPAQP